MAAGLGFKDFTTGEVLTAADVDGYLMQGIWVFASAAARDAAVTSPQEGNFAFLKDTNTTTYYTGSAWTNLDTTGMVNPMTTTGDTIYSSSGSTPARLGIGSTGQVLTVSGGLPVWSTPAGGAFVGCLIYYSTTQNIPADTGTIVTFNNEIFDTNGFHDNSTNNSRITIPSGKAGKYLIIGAVRWQTGNGYKITQIQKNGTKIVQTSMTENAGTQTAYQVSRIEDLAVGDYLQLFVQAGATLDLYAGTDATTLSVVYLGA